MKTEPFLDTEPYPPFNGFPREGLSFLRQLKKNNTRDWFNSHKVEYESLVKLPMQSFVVDLMLPMSRLAPEFDVHPKRSIFRIYRDARFSKNKTPYKTNVAAVFHLRGHWQESAGFYIHVEPGGVYVGGGIYMPDSRQLKSIRTSLVEQPKEFLSIIENPRFLKRFGAIEAEKLRRIPQGFPADHWMGEWLKYKQFIAGVEWDERESLSPRFVKKVVEVYKDLLPLIRFLNAALHKS